MANQVLAMWEKLRTVPGGDRVFSLGFTWKAPYFRSVRPRFVQVSPNYAALRLPKRRAVLNHIGTVHAIAVCNGLEAAYLAKSTSDLTCSAETDPGAWTAGPNVPVRVKATRDDGAVVVEGTI